jgi:hypothetical protein
MNSVPDTEKTTVLATYTTRRDAEMARDYLADADLQSFVKTDDAGGMHPQLQRPHGVKLVGMSGTAQRARSLLEEAGLLPDDRVAAEQGVEGRAEASEAVANSMYGLALMLGVVAVVLVLLMMLLG